MKVAIIGHSDYRSTLLSALKCMDIEPLVVVIDNSNQQHVDFELKNYNITPHFTPNPKIRSKYKRNLKYR